MNGHGKKFIIGDVHGQFQKVTGLLRGAGLISETLDWTGGNSTLWFVGDFFDRGADGLKSLDLVIRLQQQALLTGGSVDSLIGNHDILLRAVRRFDLRYPSRAAKFTDEWIRNGGHQSDLDGLTLEHIDWLTKRPALKLLNTLLLAHADSPFYAEYGSSVSEVNRAFRQLLNSEKAGDWDRLLDHFSEHYCFSERRAGGPAAAMKFLDTFGGSRLIHGHSPIHGMVNAPADQITGPHIYARRLCVNIDGGMYAGGPGFVFEVPEEWL